MNRYARIAINIAEYVLAFLFIEGGIQVFFAPPAALPGVFALLVGQFAIYAYGVIFTCTGLALAYAKIRKRKKLHKHSLFVMFLSCIYVLCLAVAVSGLSWGLTTTVLTGIVSAVLWLRWTFDTEYVSIKEFRNDPDLHE